MLNPLKSSWEDIDERDLMTAREWANLYEQGLPFSLFLTRILRVLRTDRFTELRATNAEEVALGMLTSNEVEELRDVLNLGFTENHEMRIIANNIRRRLTLQDRLIIKDGEPKVVMKAEDRPLLIARTEVSRLANKGALRFFDEIQAKEVIFNVVVGADAICLALEGRKFNLSQAEGVIPVHPNCRCFWVPVIE